MLHSHPPDLFRNLILKAIQERGLIKNGESPGDYARRMNETLTSLLAQQDWVVLAALHGETAESLCMGSCGDIHYDPRSVIESAITLKSIAASEEANQKSEIWNKRMFWLSFVTLLASMIAAMAGIFGLVSKSIGNRKSASDAPVLLFEMLPTDRSIGNRVNLRAKRIPVQDFLRIAR